MARGVDCLVRFAPRALQSDLRNLLPNLRQSTDAAVSGEAARQRAVFRPLRRDLWIVFCCLEVA
jgi:hypothetical protein